MEKLITLKILKDKRPCYNGYIQVLERYGNKFEISYDQALLDFPEYRSWIEDNLREYKPLLSSVYKGKWKLGQTIYISFALNHWRKGEIFSIEQNRIQTGFCFMVTTERSGEYNCLEDKHLFESFQDMKNSWLLQISNMTEIGR